MPRDLTPLLNRMCAAIPPITAGMGYARRTCILHTRVAVDTLRAFNIRARPLACRLMVLNAAYARRSNQLGRMLDPDEMLPEEHSIGIGFGRGEMPGYDAHVVAVVDERYILDLTLDQASRPQREISLRPGHFPAPREFLSGAEPFVFDAPDGTRVHYAAVPDDRGFLRVPDWAELPRINARNPTPRVLEALTSNLASARA